MLEPPNRENTRHVFTNPNPHPKHVINQTDNHPTHNPVPQHVDNSHHQTHKPRKHAPQDVDTQIHTKT